MRVSTLKLLRDETSLEHCLSKCMYQLFMGFGDACWQVVRISIQLVGVLGARLGPEQPEWRMLEATLDQLLFQLDICPGNNFSEGSKLMSHYVEPQALQLCPFVSCEIDAI